MKIQLLSDLHLEAHPQFTPEPAPAADVLVLAGDIGSYQEGGLLADTSFGLERFSPLPQFAGWPVPVLLVPGNHEYDAQDFDAAHHRLRTVCQGIEVAPERGANKTHAVQHQRFAPPTFTCAKPAQHAMASPFWQSRCARRRCCASNGCVTRSPVRTPGPRWQ